MRTSLKKKKKIVIVGAGLSGLVAGVYASRSGHDVLLLEKDAHCGGLVQSFTREGFVFDTGPRAFGDAGILGPLLDDLGISLPLVKGLVSTGICDDIIHYTDDDGIKAYTDSLQRLFPDSLREIAVLETNIRSSCHLMRTLRRLPNPYFYPPLSHPLYLLGTFIPWLPFFLYTALKAGLDRPIERTMDSFSSNRSLNDMVHQHFFKGTPSMFAFGYFDNFLDYRYPLGGTAMLPRALEQAFVDAGGRIQIEREAVSVSPQVRTVRDQTGTEHGFDELLWAADLNSLYLQLDERGLPVPACRRIAKERKQLLAARAGESVFTVFIGIEESPDFFRRISHGHFIYTPRKEGLGDIHRVELTRLKKNFHTRTKTEVINWLDDFLKYNSYEISIPVLKDASLAPAGKTGLIVSVLFDGELSVMMEQSAYATEFKAAIVNRMIHALDTSIYPGIRSKLRFAIPASPATLMKKFNTTFGAITGWSLEHTIPVSKNLLSVMSTVRTSMPHIWKAGQWSYSPAGVPIAVLTGRIAASAMCGAS